MNSLNEILLALGRIEGELVEIRKLSQRVATVEIWLNRLTAGGSVLVAAYLALCGLMAGRHV